MLSITPFSSCRIGRQPSRKYSEIEHEPDPMMILRAFEIAAQYPRALRTCLKVQLNRSRVADTE